MDFEFVEAREVSRHYGRRKALSRVSLCCRAGEIVGLFGPNGAGKSTLLGLFSTLLRPSLGEIRFGEHPAESLGDGVRRQIGMLGHDLFLYGDLTAAENLEFFGKLYRLPASGLPATIQHALATAKIQDRADDRVGAFSRGLRQRLALERALLHQPRLVLLDEPFTGLDDDSAAALTARLRTLRDSGAIVVMATHDFESADALVDRAVCLKDGRAREITASGGTIRERYRRTLQEAWT
ncbi:MAG TPA: ABC transporter ATP-binding protein [Vicinamibacterales bacterium]